MRGTLHTIWCLVEFIYKIIFFYLPFEVLQRYGVSQQIQEVLEGSALLIIAKQLFLLGLQDTQAHLRRAANATGLRRSRLPAPPSEAGQGWAAATLRGLRGPETPPCCQHPLCTTERAVQRHNVLSTHFAPPNVPPSCQRGQVQSPFSHQEIPAVKLLRTTSDQEKDVRIKQG